MQKFKAILKSKYCIRAHLNHKNIKRIDPECSRRATILNVLLKNINLIYIPYNGFCHKEFNLAIGSIDNIRIHDINFIAYMILIS